MNTPSAPPPARTRRRRKPLNVPLIKSLIVVMAAGVTALGSALTGIGAQVAFAPMLTWMLGFNANKARGTALRYTVIVSLSAVIGIMIGLSAGKIAGYCAMGLLLSLGATVGAMLALPLAPKPEQVGQKRMLQSFGVLLSLFVVIQAGHLSRLTINSLHYAHWNSWWALIGIGLFAGIFTQVTGLAGGVIMVPALYFIGGFDVFESVALSLMVIALVSVLPAWICSKQGLADQMYGNTAAMDGLIGAFLGGLVLMRFQEKFILMLFGAVAMFLSARELYRLSMEATPVQPQPTDSDTI